MVGDNPASGERDAEIASCTIAELADIAGANAHGWASILVRTGVFRGGRPTSEPTYTAADVEEGVHWALTKHGIL